MAVAPTRASLNRERGTTLTEAAFVTLPFFMIIFGIMEMGFLFRNYLTVSNTAAEAARAASVYGSSEEADFQILRSAEHGVAAMGVEQLDFVVIWRAAGPESQLPPQCRPPAYGGSGTQYHNSRGFDTDPSNYFAVDEINDPECNVYLPGDFSLNLIDVTDIDSDGDTTENTPYFGCTGVADNVDWGWCPLVRVDSISGNAGSGTDYVGIYVQAKHNYLTGFFQNQSTLSSTKIIRIEPEEN
jgi:hypothetical protein